MFVNVIVPFSLNEEYTYKSNIELKIGDLVMVIFKSKQTVALVSQVNVTPFNQTINYKYIQSKMDFSFKNELVDFIKWTSNYTLIPIGIVFKMCLSSFDVSKIKMKKIYCINHITDEEFLKLTKKQKMLVEFLKKETNSSKNEILTNCNISNIVLKNLIDKNFIKEITEEIDLVQKIKQFNLNTLSIEQEKAFNELNLHLNEKVLVLEGITGSGKTEIYFHLIAQILKDTDKQILILLPEIALTIQFITRFKKQFNFDPAIWHSEISESQKNDIYKSIMNNNVRVILGTRSSIFLPFNNLGLIIVDEEHDQSYKQTENGCYNGRDLAVVRAKINKIPIILSSATPSLETLINIDIGKYKKIYIGNRFGESILPKIEIIDLKKEKMYSNNYISETLKRKLKINLENKKQSMIFMNRRGYAPILICSECGEKITCPNCSINLSYHKITNTLKCHYCGYSMQILNNCPKCNSDKMIPFGPAVEKIEEELKKYFPEANIVIISSDTVNTNNKLNNIINKILNNNIDIIVGTQLIAKGHHFPNLTLVGIIDADASLFGGDIRSNEKTYQLLTQIAGRAGREKDIGEVFFQTYNPNNLLLQSIKNGDKESLIEFEKENRKLGNFPPYGKMATITFISKDESKVYYFAKKIAKIIPIDTQNIEVFGPNQNIIPKISNNFYYNIIIKTTKKVNIQKLIQQTVLKYTPVNGIKIKIDIE